MVLSNNILLSALILASEVVGHGAVISSSADGVTLPGYYDLKAGHPGTHPDSIGNNWLTPEQLVDYGYVSPSGYTTPDIICAKGATNAPNSLTVVAGHDVTVQWTIWPFSHHGPMIDYLANCNGDCTKVDKTKLLFNKISEQGLLDPNHRLIDPTYNVVSGYWASDKFREADDTWIIHIPATIAPGNYILRQETIALHSSMAGIINGTQNYPQCFNLKITGSGTDTLPVGTPGMDLYTGLEPGIHNINIFTPNESNAPPLIQNYTIPGPPLHVFDGSTPTSNPNLQGFTTSAAACRPTGSSAPTYSNISVAYPPSTPTDIAASLSAVGAGATVNPTASPSVGQSAASATGTMGAQSSSTSDPNSGSGSGSGSDSTTVSDKDTDLDTSSGGDSGGGSGGSGSTDGTVSMATLAALKDQVDALCDAFKKLTGQSTTKKRSVGNVGFRKHSRHYNKAYAALIAREGLT